jgi:hypothetical protein
LVAGQNRVVADVVNFVLAHHRGRVVRAAQDHVRRGAGRRRRVRRDGAEKAVQVVARVGVLSDDLARGVYAKCARVPVRQGIVDGRVNAAAVEEAVQATGVLVIPDDLARPVDAICICVGGERIVEGRVSAAVIEIAVPMEIVV